MPAMVSRSRSAETHDDDDDASDGPSPFEMTAGLLDAKRLKDRAWAKEAFVSGPFWLLGPGAPALVAVLLIFANEIVLHTSSTTCVRPLNGEREEGRLVALVR